MFDFSDACIPINKEFILSKISELDIFSKYCKNFEDIDKSFCSEFYEDKNPSARVYITNNSTLAYKDFGDGTWLDCFSYVQKKYNCTYHEALNIITADFGLVKQSNKIEDCKIVVNDGDLKPVSKIYTKKKKNIIVFPQNYNINDAKYWGQYGITLDILDKYNVISAKHVYYYEDKKLKAIIDYSRSNPIYAYKFVCDGEYHYKVYRPYADKKSKWLFVGSKDDIEGYDQLNLNGKLLVITKSLKDVMSYRVLGYNAISLQGEANKLSSELYNKLTKRFDRIVINYDNDEAGIKGANSIKLEYPNVDLFFVEGTKDISDYIKSNGIDAAKKLVLNGISEYIV